MAPKTPHQYVVEDGGYDSPCWTWTRARNGQGYGYVRDGGRVRPAHVVFYERESGPVPAGLELDHLCANRACVNPAHLEAVTHAENLRRGRSAKLDPARVAEIRALRGDGAKIAELAERFGVGETTISYAARGIAWA